MEMDLSSGHTHGEDGHLRTDDSYSHIMMHAQQPSLPHTRIYPMSHQPIWEIYENNNLCSI